MFSYKSKNIIKPDDSDAKIEKARFVELETDEDSEGNVHVNNINAEPRRVVFERFDKDVTEMPMEDGKDAGIQNEDRQSVYMEPMYFTNTEEILKKKLAEAEKEAEAIKQRAFEEGRSEGFAEGLEEAKSTSKAVEEIISKLENTPLKVLEDYKTWLVDAAFTIAKYIIQTELSLHPKMFLEMLKRLIEQLEDTSLVTVYLNPEDLAALRIAADLEEWISGQDRPLRFKAKPELSRGGCQVESEVELIDAHLETSLEELKKNLLA